MNDDLLSILWGEDDEVEQEMLLRGLSKQAYQLGITVASDAVKALAILDGHPGYPLLNKPYLILLDIGLPGMSGFEFLQRIRQDFRLKTSPVFILRLG